MTATQPHLHPVAVLMAVYRGDAPDLFRRALDSVFSQTIGEQSVRVYLGVDGPLTPALEDVLTDFGPRLHRVVRSDKNRGLADTLNTLISILEDEELIFRMDSDDVSLAVRFERQHQLMVQNPHLDVLGTGVREIDPSGRVVSERHYPPAGPDIRRYIAKGSPLAHATVCFRRRFFSMVPEGYRNVGSNEDLQLWFDALLAGATIGSTNEVLYLIHVDSRFYSRRSLKKSFSEFMVFLKGLWRLHGPSPLLLWPFMRLLFRIMPPVIVKAGYAGALRKRLLNRGDR